MILASIFFIKKLFLYARVPQKEDWFIPSSAICTGVGRRGNAINRTIGQNTLNKHE